MKSFLPPAVATVGIATSLLLGSCGNSSSEPPAAAIKTASKPHGRWATVAKLPPSAGDDGSLAAVGESIYAIAVRRQQGSGSVSAWRLRSKRWKREDRLALAIDATYPPLPVAIAGRLCVVARDTTRAQTWCLDGGRFRETGAALGRGPKVAPTWVPQLDLNSEAPTALVLTQLNAKVLKGGAGVAAKSSVEARRFDGQQWTDIGGPVDTDQDVNVVRPAIDSSGPRTCVAYGSQAGSKRPVPTVRCASHHGWQQLPTPPVAEDAAMVDIDGFALGTAGDYLGVDEFRRDGVSWTIRRLEENGWRRIALSQRRRGWNAQGDLFRIGTEIWAAQFNQRHSGRDILADVVVRRELSNHSIEQVGQPLLHDTPLYGPLTLDFIQQQSSVYALHSQPDPRRKRNSLVLSVYRPSR